MSHETQDGKVGAALIVGGGIGGMQAALDLAASGIKVYLADNKPAIGGVMSQLDKTFPTNDCAMCTQAPRLVEIGRHKDIEIISLSDIESLRGQAGNFNVTLKKRPRFVDEEKCTGCGTCVSNCPTRNSVQITEPAKVELEPEHGEQARNIVAKHKNRKGPLMPILQEINATFNYLPETVLRYVAQETGYPIAHIYRIVTFYGGFSVTPRGKYVINVCMGTACYVRGSERLMEKFSDVLEIKPNETTPDRKFTLNTVRCIGCCGLAPAVAIGDRVYGKLGVAGVPDIIKKYKLMQ
ncbi:MAG TPA: NAD(P)H-dependent oxidoreductase subunit E [Syntrophorhabdales bacterium]|nr:NAD(P)H-dependent oxidoreductase subunit E [Syntrophorhabdales bacterium]